MRVVRPKNQREANTLKSRLIPEALSEADRKRAEHELRIANPHLNLDRLDADSVVVVPSTVAVPEGVTVDEEAVERLRRASPEALRERIVPLRAHLEASIAR